MNTKIKKRLTITTALILIISTGYKKTVANNSTSHNIITPSANTKHPKSIGHLKAVNTEIDMGTVFPRQSVHAEFTLVNNGQTTLEINRNIGKSCGCTTPILKTYTLQPGQKCKLNVNFTADDQPGLTRKHIWLTTKPPASPRKLTLALTAHIKPLISLTPKHYTFVIEDTNTTNIAPIILNANNSKPFRILSYTCSGQVVKLQLNTRKSQTHTIPVIVNTDRLYHTPCGIITIKTDNPHAKYISVQFDSIKPFSACPSRKRFRNIKPGQKATTSIKIISNLNEPFSLGKITSEKGYIKHLNIEPIKQGYKINLTLTVPRDYKKWIVSDRLSIKIKNHPKDTLQIYCYAMLPRK